ncbi:MAG: hypothetical protein K0M64_12890 [Rhizobium sp.]|nr:hypothetical protein [Rhizobium sp.]
MKVKKTRTESDARNIDWKNHPIVIAAGSSGAMLLLCITVFTQVIIPAHTAKLELEIEKREEELRQFGEKIVSMEKQNEDLAERVSELAISRSALTETVNALQVKISQLEISNLFTPSNPYPNGLGLVRIGMPANKVEQIYGTENLMLDEDREWMISVKTQNTAFGLATYFLTDEKNVGHVSFTLTERRSEKDTFLHDRLVEAFGEPSEAKKPRMYRWRIGDHDLFQHTSGSIVVGPKDIEPVFWALGD